MNIGSLLHLERQDVNYILIRRDETIKKRIKVQNKAVVFVSVFLISMVLGYVPNAESAESKSTIKIGILYPMAGPYAVLGKRQLRGWELVFEQVN